VPNKVRPTDAKSLIEVNVKDHIGAMCATGADEGHGVE